MKKHTKIKKYECDVCLKRFYLPTDLKYHKRIHTNERPYKCSYCPKHFKRPSTRATHMRIHVNGKKCKCDHCEYRATTSQNIRKHTAAKHTQQVNVNVASSFLTTTTSSVAVAVGPLQSPMALPIIGGMRSSSSGDVLSSSFPMNSETFPLDAFFEFESELPEPEPNWTEEEGGNPFPQIPPSLINFLEHQPNHNDNNKRPRNEEDDGSATSSSSSSSSSSSLSEPLQVTKRIKI